MSEQRARLVSDGDIFVVVDMSGKPIKGKNPKGGYTSRREAAEVVREINSKPSKKK